ncbi:unnamed protein product (macronuclear) [Paramecium tetraurelia]|uniref:Cyclin-like domain-containing protein n=1 Tax=Paramecium tetraurelia TaxID=5888 RepID=A0CIK4_PARTE|nr:uncharacterized protein GSPATT00007756001 [Paramecium tetraurelia]CAK70621.1 unnamed protein product [Paramecium tetraurelia]|eukprot:XP_001438018.1 hypothetical protein (macronuclear) [Paramecium tetraurelia strain d4-2]
MKSKQSKQSSSIIASDSVSDFSSGVSVKSDKVAIVAQLGELACAIEQKPTESENQNEIENPEEIHSPLEFKLDLSMIIQKNGKTDEFYNLVLQSYLEKQNKPTEYLFIDPKGLDDEERIRFLNWLVEITQAYSMNYSTFFIVCSILDEYQKITLNVTKDNLHLTGVSCIYLASKFNDVIPLRLDQAIDISHNRLARTKILQRELEIFESLDHQLNFSNGFLFLTLLLRLYLSKIKDKENDIIEIAYFTLKLCCFDYKLQSIYYQSEISAGCLSFAVMLVNSNNQGKVSDDIATSLVHLLKTTNVVKSQYITDVGAHIEGLVDRYFYDNDFRGKIQKLIVYNLTQTELLKSYIEIRNNDS